AVSLVPDSPCETARRHCPCPEPEGGRGHIEQWMLDLDRSLDELAPADPQVPADVHGKGRVTREATGAEVGRETLARAPGIESRSHRPGEDAAFRVELECSPRRVRAGLRRRAG